jgi:outer membrane protein OmpA-like peptidoglycan-associated protein
MLGKEVIMPHNYPLLSQVQRAIRTFDKPNVIIEGHTDSTVNRRIGVIVKLQASAGQ